MEHSQNNPSVFNHDVLARLTQVAREIGLVHLGVVRLDHPGFARPRQALARFLAEGKAGTMQFLLRNQELRNQPEKLLAGAQSMLIAAVPYAGKPGPIARYAQGQDYHRVLYDRLFVLAQKVQQELANIQTSIFVDTKPILERSAAMLAGLGFIGKHGCLIIPGLGSYVLLGGLLTTAPWIGNDAKVDIERLPWTACGSCTRCLDACPTQAFSGPGDLDARKCISYLTIEHRGAIPNVLAERMGERVAGCDVCQEVCPYNAGPQRQDRAPAHAWLGPILETHQDLDVTQLVNLRSSAYRRFVKHSALKRIPRRELQRNALIALGNRQGSSNENEKKLLEQASQSNDPNITQAVLWAQQRRTS